MSTTKGPWAWQKMGNFYLLVAQHGMREIIIGSLAVKMPNESYPVMNTDGILRPVLPTMPNAALIASAPELKDKLEALVKALEQIEKIYDWVDDAAGKIAHEALTQYHTPQSG